MIVDLSHQYVFISVPKTASISIQFSLGYGHDVPEPDQYHQSIDAVLKAQPWAEPFYKFAFVRNPWARLLSLYNDFTLKRGNQYSALVKHDKPLLSEFANFEDLCLRLPESSWSKDIFFRSQTEQLSIDGKLSMDYYGRFETIEQDFKTICNHIGLGDVELLQVNVGKYDKSSHQPWYSVRAREAVAAFYKQDIENFNYEF